MPDCCCTSYDSDDESVTSMSAALSMQIQESIEAGNVDLFRRHLSSAFQNNNGHNILDNQWHAGMSILQYAVFHCQFEIVKYLILTYIEEDVLTYFSSDWHRALIESEEFANICLKEKSSLLSGITASSNRLFPVPAMVGAELKTLFVYKIENLNNILQLIALLHQCISTTPRFNYPDFFHRVELHWPSSPALVVEEEEEKHTYTAAEQAATSSSAAATAVSAAALPATSAHPSRRSVALAEEEDNTEGRTAKRARLQNP